MAEPRRILVTSALPYANGSIHIGHLVEYIQTDIWVRFQRARGHECYYVCADDAHGTPIMLKAKNEGVRPEALVGAFNAEHRADFAAFHISFDHYYSTHSPENQRYSEAMFEAARQAGFIFTRTIEQAFDEQENLFLPDRFIKGTCPKCGAADQYGDSCEQCGATYKPTDLVDAYSVLSNTPPIRKESEHYFFDLPKCQAFLQDFIKTRNLQPEVVHKLQEWFHDGLQPWDISRDAPYFGFAIPGTNGEKFFYVWLDAPIGYIASFANFAERCGLDVEAWWGAESTTELYHFIGKDIVYFHTLFWPAMLHAAGRRLPTGVFAHGFLTVNGKKMSKSRGTLIAARDWIKHLPADTLRYYFAARLTARPEDLDLNFEAFLEKYNSDVVGKITNIASRAAKLLAKHFDNHLGAPDTAWLAPMQQAGSEVIAKYEAREFAEVVRTLTDWADSTNQYLHEHAPWQLLKSGDDNEQVKAHEILTSAMHAFALITHYIAPILPEFSARAHHVLNIEPRPMVTNASSNDHTNIDAAAHATDHQTASEPLLLPHGHRLNAFQPLATRITPEHINNLIAATSEPADERHAE